MKGWKQIDAYHMRNDNWTIAKSFNVPLPYGLWEGTRMHGNYKTSAEAIAEHERVMG